MSNRRKSRLSGAEYADSTVTMKDVADYVGISMMTVSRVLNKEARVKPATRDKVLEAVKKLGYRPNIFARSLAASRSYLLGLIFDNPSSAYMSQLLIGALNRCRTIGFHLVVEACSNEPDQWADEIINMVKASRLDGIIMSPPVCDNPSVIAALLKERVPHVKISSGDDGQPTPYVFMDDRRAAREMTLLLLAQGHRDIGFISGHPDHVSSRLRREGFREAFEQMGIPVPHHRIIQGYYSYMSGFEAATQLLSETPRPTAIFASNDDMAAAVYAVAQKFEMRIPDDLSVTGFDDTPTAGIVWPALTTIRQPIAEMASAAIDLLAETVQKNGSQDAQHTPNKELDFELIERNSVAAPAFLVHSKKS